MKWVVLFLGLGVLASGCVMQDLGDSDDEGDRFDPCEPGYFVGCDDNPDALYMLETYGLNQITNTSYRLNSPKVSEGMINWLEGGHGDPGSYRAFYIGGMVHALRSVPNQTVPYWLFPVDDIVLYGETPIIGNQAIYERTYYLLWDPLEDTLEHGSLPDDFALIPQGFDGEWVLLRIREEGNRSGVAAFHIDNKDFYELFSAQENDGSFFGTPLIDSTIGGGYAFLSMLWALESGEPNAIIQVDLESGQRTEILNVTGHSIQAMDASEDYLVLQATIDGQQGIWAWSIEDQEWFFVQEERERAAVHPKVGGDWVVYLEHQSEAYHSTLVGYHIPSNSYHELIVRDFIFGIIKWDTDGQYVVVHIQVNDDRVLQFTGGQLYWMELPDV